ncbi:uncharacterized protein LOC143040340 isoform X1 [Oratosquilla oratoria]|uniref:uncharacterized protein LOC143040340 isoform X1 n=1 Tax=Oratosquilla oratoria TaxID=337810 RepID=UPI003F7746F0
MVPIDGFKNWNKMKRIRVVCGVCNLERVYSIHRGITRISGVVVCEACRQFYQKFKKYPWKVYCNKRGRCKESDEWVKVRCKACWVSIILERCPISEALYNNLARYLPEYIKESMKGHPPKPEDVPASARGSLGLQIMKDFTWVDAAYEEGKDGRLVEQGKESEGFEQIEENDVEIDVEEMMVDDPGLLDEEEGLKAKQTRSHTKKANGEDDDDREADMNVTEQPAEENLNLIRTLMLNEENALLESGNPRASERVRRKKKKVNYFHDKYSRKLMPTYGPDGTIIATGKDLCDCLQSTCPGCHFPCPRCRSQKCGAECRINRKWYYDNLEVDGTNISWRNEFIK